MLCGCVENYKIPRSLQVKGIKFKRNLNNLAATLSNKQDKSQLID